LHRRIRPMIATFEDTAVAYPAAQWPEVQPANFQTHLPSPTQEPPRESSPMSVVADGVDYTYHEHVDGRFTDMSTGRGGALSPRGSRVRLTSLAPSPDLQASFDELGDYRAYLSTNYHYRKLMEPFDNVVDFTHHVWVPVDTTDGGPRMVYLDARGLDPWQFPGLWNEPPDTGGSTTNYRESARDTSSASPPATTPTVSFPQQVFVSAAIAYDSRCYHVRRSCRNAPRAPNLKEAALCKVCLSEVGIGDVQMLTRQC
jgi:hypothetical protein